ncbi:MAG: SoxR reducing system RseC family protein [Melioribacter sp.]|nr:SoxR reducing system RseC family protein [Melioribacter sp.]
MLKEELIEEGFVISSSNGFAEVLLNKNENCNKCAAYVLCKSKDNNLSILKVIDPFNTQPGDYIKISISGKTILKTSFLVYGISLIIFLIGLFTTYFLLNNLKYVEFISILAGFFAVFTYAILLKKKRHKYDIYPKIIYVKRKINFSY